MIYLALVIKAFNYLIHAENVLLSPHVAGWTVESKIKLAQTIVDKVEAIFYSEGKIKSIEGPKRVTGIGGLFFKTDDPEKLKKWYKTHLDFNVDDFPMKTDNFLVLIDSFIDTIVLILFIDSKDATLILEWLISFPLCIL